MSIQSEIIRISQNVADSLTAVAAKGVTVPTGSTSDDLPDLIAAIQQGGGGGGGGDYPWFGPNTVKDYTKTITINLKDDTSWDSWTASTTATSILAAPTTNDFSYTYDFTQYAIFVVSQAITSYVYNSGATKKAIPISFGQFYVQYYWGVPTLTGDTFGSVIVTSASDYRLIYYNTSGNKSMTQSSYGAYFSSMPTITTSKSGNNYILGVKRSSIIAKCSSSYFAVSRKADINSANTNVVITFDVYKTPINNMFAEVCENSMLTAMRACPENT